MNNFKKIKHFINFSVNLNILIKSIKTIEFNKLNLNYAIGPLHSSTTEMWDISSSLNIAWTSSLSKVSLPIISTFCKLSLSLLLDMASTIFLKQEGVDIQSDFLYADAYPQCIKLRNLILYLTETPKSSFFEQWMSLKKSMSLSQLEADLMICSSSVSFISNQVKKISFETDLIAFEIESM